MIRKYAEIFCWKNVSSFCSAKATHIFSAKNFRILYIESAETVNKMTLNELVKLTTLWTTGPRSSWSSFVFSLLQEEGSCCVPWRWKQTTFGRRVEQKGWGDSGLCVAQRQIPWHSSEGIKITFNTFYSKQTLLPQPFGQGCLPASVFLAFLSSQSLSFISSTISLLPFSERRRKMSHKGWYVVKPQLDQKIIEKYEKYQCFLFIKSGYDQYCSFEKGALSGSIVNC